MSWRDEFYRAIGDWLNRTLPESRPHGDWLPVDRVLSVAEEVKPAGWLSDVTPVHADTRLTIRWVDTAGAEQVIAENMLLTDLMRQLT